MLPDRLVRLSINGREVEAGQGRLLIDVAEENDIFVPRFCYHPGMAPVAACRMCLVEIEGSKKPLDPACVTPVSDGMVVRTDSEIAVAAQEGVLELLLINHPLDCPICDRGGECPLQDQTLRHGPGRSRYQEPKRQFPKPIPISDLILLDRERCVLCWRCVRFAEEVAGDPFIDLMDRGSLTQINTADGAPFDSYFSGNTIQICPVGALTSNSYRFRSRPWDLSSAPTTCSYCSVGCPTSLEQRGREVLRAQALPNEHVNGFWNCDKGRFGHRYVSHPDRVRAPVKRTRTPEGTEAFVEMSWDAALDEVASRLSDAVRERGSHAVGMIGGSHTTNEDLYAAQRLMREVAGSPNLDFRTFDALYDYHLVSPDGFPGSRATLDDLDSAACILWFGPDPKEELPVLYLRIRAAVEKGAKLIVVHPRRISLTQLGLHIRYRPGRAHEVLTALGASGESGMDDARALLASGPVVACAGPQFIGAPEGLGAFGDLLSRLPNARLLLLAPNANSQGALDMGVCPDGQNGLSTSQMLDAAASGDFGFLWIVGADLVGDFPDGLLVESALASEMFVVASELFPTDTARSADVILPAASFAEKEGSFTNLERRIQKVNPAIPSPGMARADWQIFQEVARRMGSDWGWSSASDVAAEIAARVSTHSGYNWAALSQPPQATPESPDHAQSGGDWKSMFGPSSESVRAGRRGWPLSWELRAVDATRRRGWVWPAPTGGPGARRSSSSEERPAGPAPSDRPLVLLTSRLLFDAGEMASRSPELGVLTQAPMVEIHPDDARSRGLSHGAEVTVQSSRGSVRVRLRVSDDTPAGAAFIPYQQPGLRVNAFIDLSNLPTYVEVSP